MSRFPSRLRNLAVLLLGFIALAAQAQFSGGLQGSVQDPAGAAVPGAAVTLTNTDTRVAQSTTADAHGDYRFVSLAPGHYTVEASAQGFSATRVPFQLTTDQLMNVPVKLSIASAQTTVEVDGQPPVLDTAETRNQLTIPTEALEDLPLPGHDQLNLVTLAPGVTGLGTLGGGQNSQSNDNFAAETSVTASANGRASVGNMYVVDGLDITSNVTPGVLNLVPNPDTVQENNVQVNTFNVEYGRASSIVDVMTTKSGTHQYHFLASEYYTANWLQARTEFQPRETFTMPAYHTNNISTFASGPVPFLKDTFFFTGWEPLGSLTQSSSQTTVEDPAFVTWAQANYPNSVGVKLLAQYPSVNITRTSVAQTGSSLFKSTCGTSAAANIPCSLNIVDNGVFNATNYRNALQFNGRIDKYFSKDRVYANYYRTSLYTGGPSIRVAHGTPQQYLVRSIQANETHTFNSHMLNEAAFGFLRMSGLLNPTGPFHIPVISVSSAWGTGLGVSKAHENYVQHHFGWKDTFDWVHGSHDIKFGYQGFHGDNLTYFGQWYAQPSFSFLSVAAFVQDQVYSETGVSYNTNTGLPAGLAGGSFQFAGNSSGFFAQDNWRVNKKITLTYGLRWDDFGNPAGENGSIASNFYLGQGSTIAQQVANGVEKAIPHVFDHTLTAWSPRIGVAYDPTGSGRWLVRGGWGLYHDWVTLGNVQTEFGNPPSGLYTPTFQVNTASSAPIYSVGNSDTYPYGFIYPNLTGYSLDAHGGIAGQQASISANDPNLKPSNTMNYIVTVEHGFTNNSSLAVSYSGSHSFDLFSGFATRVNNTAYGVDINNFPGSLIQNNGAFVRLNPSFGSIRYTVNGPTSTYNAFIAEFKARFLKHGFFDASYTRSSSWDDAGTYYTPQQLTGNWGQFWSPSNWDTPNRYSMMVSYELPHLHGGPSFLHYLTDGWKPSAITILQSGTPFTVIASAAYDNPNKDANYATNYTNLKVSGDFNADGTNSDLPNIPSYGYNIPTDRNHQLARTASFTPIPATSPDGAGVFHALSDFTPPPSGSLPAEGNELYNRYRNPGYANTDFALLKNNRIYEKYDLQLRVEVFNLFNRANLGGINATTTSSSFGKSTSQYNARFLQLGARFQF